MRMITTLAIAFIGSGLTVAPALAAEKKISVKLDAKSEVPPNESKASGTADVTYDAATKKVTWKVSWKDLSGPAVAAHIHGPAEPGANAGVYVNLNADGQKANLEGSATLTDEQATNFSAGKTYINVHTAANKGGEIRGQIKP